jgi:hypothetical protein
VVVIAMVIPPLRSQLLAEVLDHLHPPKIDPDMVYRDSMSGM